MTAIQIQAALLRAKLTAANRDACIKSFFVGAPAPVVPPKQVASALAFGAAPTATVAVKQQHNQLSSQQQHQQQQQQILLQRGTAPQQAAPHLGNGRSDFFGGSSWNFPPTLYGSSPPARPMPADLTEFVWQQSTQQQQQQQSLTSPGALAPFENFDTSLTFCATNLDENNSLFDELSTQTGGGAGASRNIFADVDIDESDIDAFFRD